jgi:transcriptional regulator with XRE-family HTH domain
MFWENVKILLSEKKLLQKDFAELLGINISTLKNQMTRNIIPDAITSVKIAQSLGTTVEFLVTGIEPEITKQDVLNYLQNNLS